MDYAKKEERPQYSRESLMALCSPSRIEADKAGMIAILEKWKAKQDSLRPVMFIINTSGGGNRSATFTMNVLQRRRQP